MGTTFLESQFIPPDLIIPHQRKQPTKETEIKKISAQFLQLFISKKTMGND